MNPHAELVQAVLEGDHKRAVELTHTALRNGVSPKAIVESGLQAAMIEVGARFSSGEYFVADMLYAARAVTRSMDVLRPHMTVGYRASTGKVVIGTVAGDLHDIGKNLVGMFLEGAGFEVIDLGTDVSAARFVAMVDEHKPDILGMSALLTTTMPAMGATVRALEQAQLRSRVKVVVGGAPVTQHFADQIGADGYARDGGAAIETCRRLTGKWSSQPQRRV
jgi:5-methyltetrahydrofolate--homocysteine methyltransferase